MTTLVARTQRPSATFMLKWTLLTIVGWTAGSLLLFAIVWPLLEGLSQMLGLDLNIAEFQVIGGRIIMAMSVAAGIAGLAGGAVAGSAQAVALRDRIMHPTHWAAATAIGLAIGLLAGLITALTIGMARGLRLGDPGAERLLLVVPLVAAIVLGAAQWSVLRRSEPGSHLWLVAGSVGSVVLLSAIMVVGMQGVQGVAILAGLLLVTGFTGRGMARLAGPSDPTGERS